MEQGAISSAFINYLSRNLANRLSYLNNQIIYEATARYFGFLNYRHLQRFLRKIEYDTFPRMTLNVISCIDYLNALSAEPIEEFIRLLELEVHEAVKGEHHLISSLLFYGGNSIKNILSIKTPYHREAVYPGITHIKFNYQMRGLHELRWWRYNNSSSTNEEISKNSEAFNSMLDYIDGIPDLPLIIIPYFRMEEWEIRCTENRHGYAMIEEHELYVVNDIEKYLQIMHH